jgi:hypothetical protein
MKGKESKLQSSNDEHLIMVERELLKHKLNRQIKLNSRLIRDLISNNQIHAKVSQKWLIIVTICKYGGTTYNNNMQFRCTQTRESKKRWVAYQMVAARLPRIHIRIVRMLNSTES